MAASCGNLSAGLVDGRRGSTEMDCRAVPATFGNEMLDELWEEILKRDLEIEVLDRPRYLRSNLIHGVRELPVQIHRTRSAQHKQRLIGRNTPGGRQPR
jgi:hypothetical protein